MEVTSDLVKNVAKVARLELSEAEVEEMTQSFKDVLEAFSTIQEVDTENVKPSLLPVQIKNIFRNDEPKEPTSQEELLKNGKNRDGYFMGPKAV